MPCRFPNDLCALNLSSPPGTNSRLIRSPLHRFATVADLRRTCMSILAWIVLGIVAGFIASKLINKTGSGLVMDLVLGVVGAVVGGWLFNQFGSAGVTGFNLYSLFVAVIGAVVVLLIYHLVFRRSRV